MRVSEDIEFEERLSEAVGRGIADIKAGRYVTSVDEAFAHAKLHMRTTRLSEGLEYSPEFRENKEAR